MQRVKTSTAVSNLAAYTESGTPGYFTAGDAVAGTPATVPGAQWFNQVQEELLNVIKAANITPDATKDNQLVAAIAALIAAQAVVVQNASETVSGILKLATNAMALAGTDDAAAMTAKKTLAQITSLLGVSIQAYDANTAKLNVAQAWGKQQYPAQVARTGQSGAQAVDCNNSVYAITATGAITMSAPTNMVVEKFVVLRFYSASAQTISWDSTYHANSTTALPTTTVAGKWLTCTFWCVGTYLVLMAVNTEA